MNRTEMLTDPVGRYLVSYENALWKQLQKFKNGEGESLKKWDSLYDLTREHNRMHSILSDALWAEDSRLEVAQRASFEQTPSSETDGGEQ